MSSINELNAPHPIPYIDHAEGPKHKRVRRSLRLQEKGQVDSLLTVSQPDPTEALDDGPPSSVAYIKNVVEDYETLKKNYADVLEENKNLKFKYDKQGEGNPN